MNINSSKIDYIPITEILQSPSLYPSVTLPKSIVENYPQLVTVTHQELINSPADDLKIKESINSNWTSLFGTSIIISAIVLFARYFHIHTHNGLTVAASVIFLSSLIAYWLAISKTRTAYHRKLKRVAIERAARAATSDYRIIPSEQPSYPNWQIILGNNVKLPSGVSSAQVGSSEATFAKYLDRYFRSILKPSYSFKIPNFDGDGYSADFCLQFYSGLSIVIEIDEPYVFKTGEPHHCIDTGKDERRDLFFADGNWLTIRFSERQVVTQPDACCYFIARTITALIGENIFINKFDPSVGLPNKERRWSTIEAQKMADTKYRETYLPKFTSVKRVTKAVIKLKNKR